MSNLIKSSLYVPLADSLKLEPARPAAKSDASSDAEAPSELDEFRRLRNEIVTKAENKAREILRAAREESERLKAEAASEIERWWEEKRREDEAVVADAYRQGQEDGYRDGVAKAEAETAQQCQALIGEARQVLEQAYAENKRIIGEAEPFLIELAAAIAEKIIGRQLELEPDWVTDMVKRSLKRYTDKGSIALCVAPVQFALLQGAREELSHAIDAQADLQIFPDMSVGENGCVIKTPFGTIDARVDTQLAEIKRALIDVAKRSVEDDE